MTALPASADDPRRLIRLQGTVNLRDVGGYPADGGRIGWGRLYRSDALNLLTANDRVELGRRGIGLVIDLRDERERELSPSALGDLVLRIEHNPVFSTPAASFIAADARLVELYEDMVGNSGDRIADAVRLIARADEGAVLVHCTAGKDRTGLVIAFALLAAGVPRRFVVADYARTEQHLPPELLDGVVARLRAERSDEAVNLDELVRLSPASVLEGVLDRVEAAHGSVRGYLLHHGLDDGDLSALAETLIELNP